MVAHTHAADQQSTELDDWIRNEELRLAVRLREVDLVVRADFDESEIHRLQGFYGIAARRHRAAGGAIGDFVEKFPALTLTALVGHAALAYDHGRYWNSFWAELGWSRTLAFESALRQSVVPNIERFGLDRFPELSGQRYVSMLSVHAGVPVHCFGELVEVAEEYLRKGREDTGAALARWVFRSDTNPQVMHLAKPVRYFIRNGGSFAIDVLDWLIGDVRDAVFGGVRDPGDRDRGSIPKIIRDGIRAAVQLRGPRAGQDTAQRTGRLRAAPSVAYAVLDDQIVIDLPPTEYADEERWRVSIDGDTHTIEPESAWGLHWYESPPTRLPVLRPARALLVEQESEPSTWTIKLLDTTDPVLIFDTKGRWMGRRASLPKGEVLVVHPMHAKLVDDIAGVELEPYLDLGSPSGWRGWRTVAVDLSDAQSFRVVTGARRGTLRGVRVVESPRLVRSDVLPGLTTQSGIEVCGARPQLIIPGRAESDDSVWHVRIRGSDGSQLIMETYGSETEPQAVDPFEGVQRPIAGLFDIAVTGAAGSSLQFTVFVLEGVGVDLDPWLRVPAGSGLSEATVKFSSTWGISCIEDSVKFTGDEIRKMAVFSRRGSTHRLVFTYPHVRFHVGAGGEPIRWRSSAVVLLQQELDETPNMVLNVPNCVALRLELLDDSGSRLKWLCPRKTQDEFFEADLRVFADVTRIAGDCRLTAVAVSDDQNIARFLVATIRPVGTCREVYVEDGNLIFEGLKVVDNLAAHIWWISAPWASPVEIAVTDTRVSLPKELLKAGDLYVQLFVSDPWVHADVPAWPDDKAFRVDQPGYRRDRNNGRERLSKYLVNGGHAPTSVATMPEIWAVLARTVDDDVESVRAAQMRRDLLHVVSENARTALETLGNSTIPVTHLPPLVVWTGLAAKSYRAGFTLNELHAHRWVGCMVEIADLPSLFARRNEVLGERVATISYLQEQGGEALIHLLASGATTGTTRPESEIVIDLIELGDDALEHFASELRSVPSALFSAESRWSAFFEAFDLRDNLDVSGLAAEALHLASTVERVSPVLTRTIGQRRAVFEYGVEGSEWTAVPLFTSVLASWARLEAHGLLEDSIPPGLVEQWARIAVRCPTLVITDLLHAEAAVTFERFGDLISDPD